MHIIDLKKIIWKCWPHDILEKAVMETVKNSVVARISRKESWVGETFLGSETTLLKIVMVDTHYYTFFKTHRIYNTKNAP